MLEQTENWHQAGEGIYRRIVADGAQLMLVEVHFEPGAIGIPHRHPHEQATRVLKGKVRFTLEKQVQELVAGDYLLIPPNILHGTVALEESVLLDVFSPPRQDLRTETKL